MLVLASLARHAPIRPGAISDVEFAISTVGDHDDQVISPPAVTTSVGTRLGANLDTYGSIFGDLKACFTGRVADVPWDLFAPLMRDLRS